MPDPGEELVGEYLKNIIGCQFVEYNLQTPDVQGEIDVIGIEVKNKALYVCEVATHLGGLQYTKNNQPDNVDRFVKKFQKNIPYAREYFGDYTLNFMIWSPVVRVAGKLAKHNAYQDLLNVSTKLEAEFGVQIQVVINADYQRKLNELSTFARNSSKALNSPIMRTLQIQEKLAKHVENLNRKANS